MLVDIDDVLDLFDASDAGIYAKETIREALHDGTLKGIEVEAEGGEA